MSGFALPTADELAARVSEAAALPGLDVRREQLAALVRDYARGLASERHALSIALVGATGAGKSTLLNALAGAELARPGEDRPTSTRAVVYAPEDAQVGELAATGATVHRYRPGAAGAWSGHVLIDTPDLNSIERAHRDTALAVLELADVAVVVMHRGSVVEAVQREVLAPFARRRRWVLALNFGDELGEEARAQLKSQALAAVGGAADDTPVFAISALAARRGLDPTGEWTAFVDTLRRLGEGATLERVRRSNAVGALREVVGLLSPALESVERAGGAVREALAGGLQSAGALLADDFRERLEVAGPYLTAEVRRAASARWWGPAALWMRLSAVGAGGLGTAALVARRSLPVGVAVGVASVAMEKLREETRAHAAESRLNAAPRAAEEAAQVAVAAARTLAAREGLPPELVGVPAVDDVQAGIVRLRADVTRRMNGELVAKAVGRWWRWARVLLLPLVNLPLLVLIGHVGYSVVRGYLSGRYLGLDYFLNAGAMAVVVSVVGATLASASLRGTTSRVRADTVAELERALESWRATLLSWPAPGLDRPRAAVGALRAMLSRLG